VHDTPDIADRRDAVCVIGAGASGLAAIKNLREHGFAVDCYERETSVGGAWNWRHDRSPVYSATHLISSRPLTEFPDFPMPDSWPDYPHHSQVLAYFERYADHFDLRSHIWFGTEVVRVEPAPGERWDVTTRSTGYNQIDLAAARKSGIKVTRVANYSPNSVAEFAVALLLALNRKIPRAYNRTRDGNFELDGLMGFDLVNRTVAVLGTGKIGTIFGRIMNGFGCKVLGYDAHRSPEFEKIGRYAGVDEIQADADVISLHVPLTPQTKHVVNARTIAKVKKGALLINTSRGGLVDTEAAIEGLKSGQLGGMAIDVYENEASLFFRDLSGSIIEDDVIQRLVSFPNVILTAHQAFFTREALEEIMNTTLANVSDFAAGLPLKNEVKEP